MGDGVNREAAGRTNNRDKNTRRHRKMKWALEYAAAVAAYHVLRLIPFSPASGLGSLLGSLWFSIDKRHQDVTLDNLRRSFNDKTPDEIRDIAISVHKNIGRSGIEFVKSARYGSAPLDEHFVFTNYEAFEKAHAKGKGVIFLTAHCGNWELMALSQSLRGYPIGVVVRPLDNPYLDRAVSAIRSRFGNRMINKNRGMREILRTLGEGGSVGILLDQNVSVREGVFVDFFGRPACTNKGLALIAAKTRAPVVPAFARRLGPDRHEIVLGDELPLIDTGDKQADILANTQAYTKEIERFVRKYPDQWFWMHRRWKTRPPSGEDA